MSSPSNSACLQTQQQIVANQEDLKMFLTGLAGWEEDMKKKDLELQNATTATEETTKATDPKKPEETKKFESSECNEDEKKLEKRKQQAVELKELGNSHFLKGKYQEAVKYYTEGIAKDSKNHIIIANRAQAYLKLNDYSHAEEDCTSALLIDPKYVKAYMRRGIAKKCMEKFYSAKQDFLDVLELEPNNKQTLNELREVEKEMQSRFSQDLSIPLDSKGFGPKCVIQPLTEPRDITSRKTLIPVTVEDIENVDNAQDIQNVDNAPISTVPSCSKSTLPTNKTLDFEMSSKGDNGITVISSHDGQEVPTADSIEDCKKLPKSEYNAISTVDTSHDSIPVKTPTLPPIPYQSYQFSSDWKTLEKFPSLRYKYLRQFPPDKIPTLFKHVMEPSIFEGIIKILSTFFLRNGDDVFLYMKFLSEIGRFKILGMMLSRGPNSDVSALLRNIRINRLYSDEDVDDICRRYEFY